MTEGFILFALFAFIAALAAYAGLAAYRRAGGGKRAAALAACALVGLAPLGLYLWLGKPYLPDAPYAERIAALKQRAPDTYTDEEMLARLAAEARAHPEDPRPHLATGVIYAQHERYEEAARAFDAALRRDPSSAFAMINLGRALYFMNEGRVTPDALRLFETAARAEPDDPTPVFYQALAATQDGRTEDARRLWREMLRLLPVNDRRRQMAERMLAQANGSQTGR